MEITEIYAKEQPAGAYIIWPDTVKFYFDEDALSYEAKKVLSETSKQKFKGKPDLKLIK